MIPGPCDREPEILRAAREGRWTDELRGHASSCPACADALLVERFLTAEAETLAVEASPTDPGALLWRHRLAARRERAERATRPIRALERLAAGCGVATTAAALAWGWPALRAWLTPLAESVSEASRAAAASPTSAALLAAGLLLASLLLAGYSAWAEE